MKTNKNTMDSRRQFIKNISFASAFLLTGKISNLSAAEVINYRHKVKLRFVVASDIHYGQPDTAYEQMLETATKHINLFHDQSPLDFCVMNGDLIHNDKSFMPLVKAKLDVLTMPYYVTRGNHDMVSSDYWDSIWGMPLNHDVLIKECHFVRGYFQ